MLYRLLTGTAGASHSRSRGAWYILKCFICAEAGLFLISLATVNPSLSVLLAIPSVPLFAIMAPSKSPTWTLVQFLLLTLVSPAGIVLLLSFLGDTDALRHILEVSVNHWNTYGAIFYPVICLFYWPLNIAAQVLITMPL